MRYILLFLTVVLVSSCASTNKVSGFSENVVIAHRGAWKANGHPENSIAALREAVKMKCTGSEFDVRMTKNDSLIVTHDADYADLIIEETTYEELSKFPLPNGEVLPTLRNYLLAGMENNTATRLVCEIKPCKNKERSILMTERVFELVEELEAKEKVFYISFGYNILKRLEELDPKVHTQYLDGSKSPDQLKADGIDGADYYFTIFQKNPEWVANAKENTISLNAWTVNKATDIDWFLDAGFDFITTNEPELILERAQMKEKEKSK